MRCARCRRPLKNPDSIRHCMGPKCYANWEKAMERKQKQKDQEQQELEVEQGRGR